MITTHEKKLVARRLIAKNKSSTYMTSPQVDRVLRIASTGDLSINTTPNTSTNEELGGN